jgi:hypothetical protein
MKHIFYFSFYFYIITLFAEYGKMIYNYSTLQFNKVIKSAVRDLALRSAGNLSSFGQGANSNPSAGKDDMSIIDFLVVEVFLIIKH